jgi:hypothetical protein
MTACIRTILLLTEFRSEQAIVIHLYREAHKHFEMHKMTRKGHATL